MKIYNRGVVILETTDEDLLYCRATPEINGTVLFPKIMNLFPDHEQVRQLTSELLIVVGHKQDTILLDIVH